MGLLDRLFSGKQPDKRQSTSEANSLSTNPPPDSNPSIGIVYDNTPSVWPVENKAINAHSLVKEYWCALGKVQQREVIDRAMLQIPALDACEFSKLVIKYGKEVLLQNRPPLQTESYWESRNAFEWRKVKDLEVYGIFRWYFSDLLHRVHPEPPSQPHALAFSEAFSPFWKQFVDCMEMAWGGFRISKVPMLENPFKHYPILGEKGKLEALETLVRNDSRLALWLDNIAQSKEIAQIYPILISVLNTTDWKPRKELNAAVKRSFTPQDSYSIARTLSAMENLWVIESKREGSETFFKILWY